jgi:hypothetical protein
MSDVFVFAGGDHLAWLSRRLSAIGAGTRWREGYLPEPIALPDSGRRSARDMRLEASLAERLNGAVSWQFEDGKEPVVRLHSAESSPFRAPVLPPWAELCARQASMATEQLGSTGTLVTPAAWREAGESGAVYLDAWAGCGWSWAPLETVLASELGGGKRWVLASRFWILSEESSTESLVVPNGPVASFACRLAALLLRKVREEGPAELVAAWKQDHGDTAWWLRQQVMRLTEVAWASRRASFLLGGNEAPLFAFATEVERVRFEPLSRLCFEVDLPTPRPDPAAWWDQRLKARRTELRRVQRSRALGWERPPTFVNLPGFARHSQEGSAHRAALVEVSASPEEWVLTQLVEGSVRPQEPTPPVQPELEPDEPASAVSESVGEPRALTPAASDPPPEAPPTASLPPPPQLAAQHLLAGFRPEVLPLGWLPGARHLRVLIDGEELPGSAVQGSRGRGEATLHLLETDVRHGAVVRIDFEEEGAS